MASRFTDFPNGIASVTDYLSSQNSLNAQLSGSAADIERLVISAQMDFNLKEIICSLLAGRGLKLPNIQICLSLNLKELLGGIIGQVQQVLYDALARLDTALDKFLSHLKLDEVLGRINGLLGQITNIANMINFCSAPLDPIQIPNVLENVMQSFLGKGKDIIDKIGSIIPGEIGGCLIDGQFNPDIWDGGIFQKIADNIDDLDSITDTLITDIDAVVADIDELVTSEDTTPTTYDNGGSDLSETPRPTYTGIGALFNAQDEGIGGAVRNGSSLWAAYQQLASYQVVDNRGVIYNNIFETFVDDDLIRILRRPPNPVADIVEQQPVYNYCGEIIGYTRVATQESPQVSVGAIPNPITQPGFNAGGLPTNPINAALAQEAGAGGGTVTQEVNNTYNLDGAALFVGSEIELLAANTQTGQLAYRTDINTTYIDNGGTTNTIADFTVIGGSSSGSSSLGTITTTNATPTEVVFSGLRKTPGSNKSWFVEITAVANRTGTADTTAIRIEGLVNNATGAITIVGTTGNKTVYNSTAATVNYDLLLDVVTGTDFRVRVQGDTGHTVTWAVRYDFIEA